MRSELTKELQTEDLDFYRPPLRAQWLSEEEEDVKSDTGTAEIIEKAAEIIADDNAKVSIETDRVAVDGKTGKPVADVTRYTYRHADTRYIVSFERDKTTLQAIFTDRMPLLKRIVARLIGFDGAYHRFTGKVTIEKFEGGVRVERFDDRAIWELMYFGKARSGA
jgi:hypothetical protein